MLKSPCDCRFWLQFGLIKLVAAKSVSIWERELAEKRMFREGFAWLKALPLLAVTGALAIIALSALVGAQSPDARSREALFDYFQRLSPAQYDADETFHLVLIDQDSIDAVGPWPWPRTVLADLVTRTDAAGAAGIIITEPLDSPDPLSPETIGAFWLEGASDEALARELARLPSTDETLATAFSGLRGGVGVSLGIPIDPFSEASFQRADIASATWLDAGGAEYIALPTARYQYKLNDALASNTMPVVTAIPLDHDGTARRLPILWALNGAPAPSVALFAADLADSPESINVTIDQSAAQSQGRVIRGITVNNNDVSLTRNSSMRLHFPKKTTVSSTSASRILAGRNSNSQIAGKVVLIGRGSDIGSVIKTARGEKTPAALHALAGAQLINGEAPARPGWAGIAEALGVMIFGAVAIMFAQKLQFWQAIGIAAATSAFLILIAFLAFQNASLLIDPLAPSLALFVGALSVAGGRSIGGALRDDSLRGSFHDTLPEPVMKKLREDGAGDLLTGAYRDVTVLACELRLADDDLRTLETLPDDVTKILAAASLDLRQTIIDAGGAADQAEGGRLFAYFNVPGELADHIQTGCAAALRLVESMDKINTSLESSSRTRGVQVHLAIGIATGRCFAGPMGHGRNNRYSAVGPAVDRAELLRNQSEFYGPAMICDEIVYKETHHQFAYLELDRVKTRNAERPFSLYALIGNPFIKSSKGFRDLDDAHRALLNAYREGDVATAKTMLAQAQKSPGAKIALFDIYQERLDALEKNGVPAGWGGITQAEA